MNSKLDTLVDPREFVSQAIRVEMAENLGCDMAKMMSELLLRHDRGDKDALSLAVQMASDTLRPRRSLANQIRGFFSEGTRRRK